MAREVVDPLTCAVTSGTLYDTYTGTKIEIPGQVVQVDHRVAVKDAWRTNAAFWTLEERKRFYNDPLNLESTGGVTNDIKGFKNAKGWLPKKAYRCSYIAAQILVKDKYHLSVTPSEFETMADIIQDCPRDIPVIQ